jgi:hypothetical protein
MARTASTFGSAGILAAGGTAALLADLAGSAGASATIVVDSSADGTADANHCTDGTPGNCTIRDAAAADGDIITFDAAITNITLTEGEIGTQAVSIVGPGSSALTITTAGVPGAYDMFRIGGTGDALISGLTLTKNRIKSLNTEKFTLDDVAITGSTGNYGGALYAGNGDLEIRNSHFEDNCATKNGGAVYIYNGADATISDSEFVNNESSREGGAIFSDDAQDITLIDSEITGNVAGERGGGLNFGEGVLGDVSIVGCTFDSNHTQEYGGAAEFGQGLDIVVSNTTVSNNSAVGGAGLNFDSDNITATINNSTITANAAVKGGGGIYINENASLTINQSTVSANSAGGTTLGYGGGGIAIGSDTTVVTMSGTIVSGNTSAVDGEADISLYSENTGDVGSFSSANSIIGEFDSRLTHTSTDDVLSTDPMLGELADNGGATKTMALLSGSPAIDAGPNPVTAFVGNEFDQRGPGFIRIVDGRVDIAAFEVQADTGPTTTSTAAGQPVVPAFTG